MTNGFSRGWSLLLCITPETRVLEVGDDDGERARALAAAGASVTCLRHDEARARELRASGLEAVVAAEPPVAEFDAAIVSAALSRSRGLEWQVGDLPGLLSLVARRLRPGGSVVLALPNPLYGLPVLGWLSRRVRGARASGGARGGWFARPMDSRRLGEAFERAGLQGVRVFAPLPTAARLKFLVPLDEPAALRYFFTHLAPRPRGPLQRLGLAVGGWAAAHGLLGRIIPEFEAIGVKPGPA